MAYTFAEHVVALDEMAVAINAHRKKMTTALATAKTNTDEVVSDLGLMPTVYGEVIASIISAGTAEPNNAAAQNNSAAATKLTAEFVALKTVATARKTALDAVE